MKLIKMIALTIAVFNVIGAYADPLSTCKRNKTLYDTDGHYWTVLVIATQLKIPEAKAIAYNAEYPDNVINSDGYNVQNRFTFLNPATQKKVHALTGRNPEYELAFSKQMMNKAIGVKDKGVAIHRLGDSFSHINDRKGKMFPYLIGHLMQWQKPDKISTNPNRYLMYVRELIIGLGGNLDLIDMTVFNYIATAGLSSEANCAILKAEYNILNKSVAFNAPEEYLQVVEKYLKARWSGKADSYVIHTNTDEKGYITKTIVLTAKNYSSQDLFPELINTTEPTFLPVPSRIRKGFFATFAMGIIFGTIKGIDMSGTKVSMNYPGFGWDLQVGGALKNNLLIHGILARKTMANPDLPIHQTIHDLSIDETIVGIGLTNYFKHNFLFTGNVGLGSFSLTEKGTSFLTEYGFSYQIKAGKEWRVSNTFSLGTSLTYSGTSLSNTWGGGNKAQWNSGIFGIMITTIFSKGR